MLNVNQVIYLSDLVNQINHKAISVWSSVSTPYRKRWYLYGGSVIKIGKLGLIQSGDNQGLQIKVLDDSDNTGGFLIITGIDINNPNSEAFDSWVSSQEELQGYFNESNWVIKWL